MNMKKKTGVCATLLAALLFAVPQSAEAAGKIRSVDVYDPDGVHTEFGAANALTVGDTIYVRFRLVNLGWYTTETNSAYSNPWTFMYTGTLTGNETTDELIQLAASRPRLGLWVSGRVREAEMVTFPPTVSDWMTDKLSSDHGPHYTDVIFKYTIQAGDLALPIQLANADGTGPASGTSVGSYYLKYNGNAVPWALYDTKTYSVSPEFAFGPATLSDDPDFAFPDLVDSWESVSRYENRDLDLSQAGVYAQALDFDTIYQDEDSGVWRSVAQGSTTTEPQVPTIAISGGSASPMYLYLWTDDTNVAEVVKGGQVEEEPVQYVFGDGVTRTVGKVHVYTGNESVPFLVKATGSVGGTAKVFLAATPTNIYNAAGDIITNFITRTVVVGEPLPPSISVTVGGASKVTVTANSDYDTALVGVNVTLTEAYSSDLNIPIKVTVKEDSSLVASNYVGMSQASTEDNTAWDDVLTVRAGNLTAAQSLWMYANRGTVLTESGLLVEVDTNRMDAAALAFFTGKFIAGTVVLNRSTPEITADLAAITAEANTDQEITINVSDAYGEMRDPCRYSVYWSNSGNDSAAYYTAITGLTATAAGDITFSVKYTTKGDYISKYYVVNEDGKASSKHEVAVTVTAQKVVEATVAQKRFAEDYVNAQDVVTLTFGDDGFSLPDGGDAYIFFVPRSANASNLVECESCELVGGANDWKSGILVGNGDTSVGPIQMTLLDGNTKGLSMGYDIVVRTAESYDDGDVVSSWSSKGFSFIVTNVVPTVTQVSMSGSRLSVDGGQMKAHASLGVAKTFTAITSEPSDADLYADEENSYADTTTAFATEWSFDYGNGTPDTRYVYGPPSRGLSYAFTQSGTCTVTVRMCDKDMDHNRDTWGPEFTFTVIVDAKPSISLSPYNGLDQFYESAIGAQAGRINVGLSMLPSTNITVHVDVRKAGTDTDNYPMPVLNSYDIDFNGSTTNRYFYFQELDGTPQGGSAGYVLSAYVTNTTVNADGVAWKDLYEAAELQVTIVNEDPFIVTRPGTNEIQKAENESFRISYTMRDVPADFVGDGISVTWQTSEGDSTNYTVTATGNGQYVNYSGTSPVFSFKSAGSKTVTLLIEDKDGGYDQQIWRYYVSPSKSVLIYPRQPDQLGGRSGNISSFSANYTGAAGIGDGRVWVTEGSVVEFSDFVHKYTFDPTMASISVYARGYRVGDIDNGSLQPGLDITIDANGNHYKSGTYSTYYTSEELTGRDSFFYCWIYNSSGEGGGGYTGSLLNGTFLPAVEVKGKYVANGQQMVTLPEYEEDIVSYQPTVLEAIFSKEYLATDNVGDINQDGIPDIFAVGYTYNGGKLYEYANGGSTDGGESEGESSSATDVKPRLVNFNGDADYLPADSVTSGNILITADSWTTVGRPFTADLEIRGFDSNLNYRAANDGNNYRVLGAWVSEPTFSPAESNAIVYVNKQRGIYEFTWPLPDPTNDTYAAAVANWTTGLNKSNCWIPENRTDPTMDDTDGDGFPDGYEYYFWYMSTVGWMEKGEWKRLEGEKFQLDNIAKGVALDPDDIASAFNPTVAAGALDASTRDTDGDGLTDLEELAAGTNPVHWDSDGDGMSDLWEILRGLDPLKKDAGANADGDFMALADLEDDYAVLTFTTNKVTEIWAVANNGYGVVDQATSVMLESATGTVSGVRVYRYGNDDSRWSPISRGTFNGSPEAATKPLDASEIDLAAVLEAVDDNGIVALTNQHLRLVHDQVYAQYGFDPRTAWYKDNEGYVAARWNVSKSSAKHAGETGKASNTAKFTALDEYLLLKYRYSTKPVHLKVNPADDTDKTYSVSRDKANVKSGKMTLADVLNLGTTNPNVPFEGKTYGNLGSSSSGSDSGETSSTNSTATTYSSMNHGADTDGDGVPDGWELYVRHNPNSAGADDLKDNDYGNTDKLGLVSEYAGTDSCDAYALAVDGNGEATIYTNHPGVVKGWYNKFFPTDPWNPDTDGDGIDDGKEGNTWEAAFRYGNVGSEDVHTHTYTFIYGPNDGKPEADDGTICIRGGGLNPCTVDTDGDLLPDPWERDFAGVVFTAEGQPDKIGLKDSLITLIRRSDNLATGATAVQPYITAGMDGTHGFRMEDAVQTGDAYTSVTYTDPYTGTIRNYDFDHDGLQNFQEYLVQSLRHLRYDDKDTPLLGQWMPDGTPSSRQFFAFVPMNIMDGETFYAKVKKAGFPATGAWKFSELGYFARPPHEWDLVAQNRKSKDAVAYDEYGFRVMLRPQFTSGGNAVEAVTYCSTDPRMFDTDQDGMDDYYEIFHGLNPLLGSIGDPSAGAVAGDVISRAYNGGIAWWCNAWTGWPMMSPFGDGNSPYDAMKYPWMMGTPEADADGDGIINSDEALLVNLATPMPTHTDPTPLWMTDSTAAYSSSYTTQYYMMDSDADEPDFMKVYPWQWKTSDGSTHENKKYWMFAFEENEGYDTDHDGLNDLSEGSTTATVASDPLNFTDPDRRQALWFPGENSAAVSYNSTFRREVELEYSLLKRFTVEAWICPEDVSREQVIIERAVNCTPTTLSNNVAQIRANFRIGITADGRLYGQFDTSDAVASGSGDASPRAVSSFKQETNVWAHVALSYDGSALTLYVDGKISGKFLTSLIPANGILVLAQDAVPDAAFPVLRKGYQVLDSAVVLGASSISANALKLSDKTTWDDFGSFYAGYVDEVRVWDDVRTPVQIAASMNKRFSLDDVKALRNTVYASWLKNGTRNENDGYPNLPAELLLHYNFQSLFGAVDAADVAREPSGFTKNVIDNVRIDDDYVPGGLYCGWWYALKDTVGSTVYRNYNLVPWIQNTCAHLPLMDGSAVDSQYWSECFGGLAYASEVLPTPETASSAAPQFRFSNSANPYPYYNYAGDRWYHDKTLEMLADLDSSCTSNSMAWEFEMRTGFVGATDLVPLGGAFAKRSSDMWDGAGPASSWELAGWDEDSDGIPDWWEAVAIDNYGVSDGFTWDSEVDYGGLTLTAREAYLRDLANGMLPDGSVDDAFRTKTDSNANGLPDWWENLYGVNSAAEDQDGDGLSNYAEYLIGECFVKYGFPRVDPAKKFSLGQVVPDYFLRVGKLYLGEMFADHDFVEDIWEDQFDVDYASRYVYDAHLDPDDDGWSNYAEVRANTDPSRQNVDAIDEFQVAQYPIPTIKAHVFYNGQAVLNYPVIVEAYSKNSGVSGLPDAIWATGSSEALTKYLGLNPNTEMTFTLGPGAVKPGSIKVYLKDPAYYVGSSITNLMRGTLASAEWKPILSDKIKQGSTTEGLIVWSDEEVGSVNYETGEISIDFASDILQSMVRVREIEEATSSSSSSDSSSEQLLFMDLAKSYVYLEWESEVPSGNSSVTLSLADSIPDSESFKSRGHVREGENMFAVYLDKDSNNKWTPGEPYGVAYGVDVGWYGAEFSVELTDTAPQTYRIDLVSAFQANDYESQRALNDRGVLGYPGGDNKAVESPGTNMPSVASDEVRVRVVRTEINGLSVRNGKSALGTVYDTVIHPATRFNFTELNVMESASDLDWSTLMTAASAMGLGTAAVTNATYCLVIGNEAVSSVSNNSIATSFQNVFESGAAATRCEPVSPKGSIYCGQPTFKWTHENSIGKSYPAFRLRVWASTGSKVVYDSGVQPAPVRNSKGEYSWTAPIYADAPTPSGVIFATTNNYKWSVSMLDAKFTAPSSETKQEFRLEASGALGTISEYGTINARVKYFGPAKTTDTLASVPKQIVLVQAFTTPDFSGTPAGAGWVTNVSSLASQDEFAVNAVIRGVKPGTYYLRAFIDTDGDGEKDEWESWGYGCYVGSDDAPYANVMRGGDSAASAADFPYTPRPCEVEAGVSAPIVDIYMEDVDTDNDGLPDVYEIDAKNSLETLSSPSGSSFFTKVNTNLATTVSAYTDLGVSVGADSRNYAVMTLMNTLIAESDPSVTAAAGTLLSALPEDALDEERTVVTIKSFSLADGVEIAVETTVPSAKSGQIVVVTADEAQVDLYLSCAGTVDFADAVEVKVKSFTIRANDTTKLVVSAEELAAAKAQAPDAKFFKAIIR